MSEVKQRDLIDYLQWLFTLLIAVGGFYLNWQQGELQKEQQALRVMQTAVDVRSQRERMIQLFADKTFSYIDKMGIGDADKQDVLIELVDIITEINVTETGKVEESDRDSYKEQKSLIPLRLALVTGNDDILAHITRSSDKQKLWVSFAEKSNNDIVRGTAIRALGQIYRHTDDSRRDSGQSPQQHDYKYGVEKIMSISKELTDDATGTDAAEAIAQIEQAILSAEDLPSIEELDDENLKALLKKAKANNRNREVKYTFRSADIAVDSKTGDTVETGAAQKALERTEATIQLFDPTGAVEIGYEEESVETVGEETSDEIDRLISDLTSDDTKKRRGARSALIEHGNIAVAPMLDAYENVDPSDRYRVGLGVAYVLYKMKQPVRIPADNEDAVKSLIDLIGESQADIRKYASEFLMKLYDEQSVDVVYNGLKEIIETEQETEQPNGNKLYNTVVVLGTWMRILPSQFVSKKEEIRNDLEDLRERLKDDKAWQRTVRLIDEMLA